MRTAFARFGLVAAVALLASATSLKAQEITYMSNIAETFPVHAPFKTLTLEYQKDHPDAKWEFITATQQTIMQNVQVMAASDSLPLLFTLPDRSAARDLYKAGHIVDLIPILKKLDLLKHFDPLAVSRMQLEENVGGEVMYSMPIQGPIEGIGYNKKIFADHGIEPPKTWTEFVAACEKVHAAGIQCLSVAGADSWPILRLMGMYSTRLLGDDAMERVRDGKLPLTDPGFVQTAAAMQELGTKGYMGPAVTTMTYGPSLDLFTGGKAAMMFVTAGAVGPLSKEGNAVPASDIGFINFPMVEGGKGTADAWGMGLGQALHMSKTAYEADMEAIDNWLKYVIPRYGDLNRALGSIPGIIPANPDAPVSEMLKLFEAKRAEAKAGIFPWEQHFTSRAFILAGTTAAQMATGAITPEKYIADVAAANKR
jgi:raffinose/stachyose/melibiose transport system substrate-binding protein